MKTSQVVSHKKKHRGAAWLLAGVMFLTGSGFSNVVFAADNAAAEDFRASAAEEFTADGNTVSGEDFTISEPVEAAEEQPADEPEQGSVSSEQQADSSQPERDEKNQPEESSQPESAESTLLGNGALTDTVTSKAPEASSELETDAEDSSVLPIADAGLLEMTLPVGVSSFVPNQSGQEIVINYMPRKEGTAHTIEISGYSTAGLQQKLPVVSAPIAKAYLSGSDKVVIEFDGSVKVGTTVSFRVPVANKTDEAGEMAFANGVSMINGTPYGTGLILTEYTDGTADQTFQSKVPVSYSMTADDLKTEMSYQSIILTQIFASGMALYTNIETANDGASDGTNWLRQEADYWIQTFESSSSGSRAISSRYIQNLRLEIPLPPGVAFVSSPLETKTNGVQISASADKSTIYYTADEYIPRSEIKFRMTLDYTGVPNSGQSLKTKDINDWFDLYSNKTSIAARRQTGKAWSFSGKIYGVPQQKTFYDRSALVFDIFGPTTFNTVFGNSDKSAEANKNYYEAKTYKIYPDLSQDAGVFSTIKPQLIGYNHNYARRAVFTMDPAIQLSSVYFTDDTRKAGGNLTLFFSTSEGRELQATKILFGIGTVNVPTLHAGEYVTKLIVQTTGDRTASFYLNAFLKTTNEDGSPMSAGTKSNISVYFDVLNYGTVNPTPSEKKPSFTGTVTYAPPIPAKPNVELKAIRSDTGRNAFTLNNTYSEINLFRVTNDGAENSNFARSELKNLKVTPQQIRVLNTSDTEAVFIYQMLSKSPATLKLTGYSSGNYPDVKIIYTTSLGNTGEIAVDKSQFTGGNAPKVTFNLPEGEVVSSIGMEVSNMPPNAGVSLTVDQFKVTGDTLPSGRMMNTLPAQNNIYGPTYTRWEMLGFSCAYMDESGNNYLDKVSRVDMADLYWNLGVVFSKVYYTDINEYYSRPTILQGEKTTVDFILNDTAFNPTYAFEVDKNFNYVPGTFQGINKNYKYIEEWLPNYFTDPTDTDHYGNGLLRIRFIGSGSEAFNLFPISNFQYTPSSLTQDPHFQLTLQAKLQAVPGTYQQVSNVYRSDKWALENIVGKEMAITKWTGLTNVLPELGNLTSMRVIDYVAMGGSREADPYDIDGDGNTGVSIVRAKISANYPAYQQQVTKMTTTNIRTWLTDKKTGQEMADAILYPHEEVTFNQSMEIIGSKNATDFIGYYHIPKRNHKITYTDADGNTQNYLSEFNTYLTDFINTTIDGQPVPSSAGMEVFYYLSPNPADPDSDDHNTMNELTGGTDSSPYYLTEQQVRDKAAAEGKSIAEILENCTMIKFKAATVTAGVSILSTTTLKIGHKETGDKQNITDYFSGRYTYTSDSVSLPVSSTPLVTMTMVPYSVAGTLFYDKNANSFLDAIDGSIEGINVELYQTGHDPHTGAAIADTLLETQTTAADGSYKFIVPYHGDYYLKFTMPNGKILSTKQKSGGFDYEQSVFQMKSGDAVSDTFTLDSADFLYQNAGLVDERELKVPSDIYLSVGETRAIDYQITPDYLMNDPIFQIEPTLDSKTANEQFFAANGSSFKLTGKKVGEGKITLSIPAAPLDGSTMITKEITVHVEPEFVSSVSVPTKAEIYALQGDTSDKSKLIAPIMTVSNYGKDPVRVFVRNISRDNTGSNPVLNLVENKGDRYDYAADTLSLSIIKTERDNVFSGIAETNVLGLDVLANGKGLLLGELQDFNSSENWGQFTFSGDYNPNILSTELEDNRFVLRYRVEQVSP